MNDKKRKIFAALGITCAICLMVAAAYFSLELGVFTAGFVSVFGFVIFDNSRRRFWENSVSFKLKRLEDGQSAIAMQLSGAAEDLGTLKETASHTETVTRRNREEAFRSPPPRRVLRPPENDSMPRALRAGEEAPEAPQTSSRRYGVIANNPALTDQAVRGIINDAARGNRVEMFLQPIVRLPQRKVRYYEMFAQLRARPGIYLTASRYMPLALEGSMMRDIERLLLTDCLDLLEKTEELERAAPFFINITTGAVKSALFMKKLIGFIGSHRELADRLVFEVMQKDFEKLDPAATEIIKGLGKLGCSFSIDNVKEFNFDVAKLQALKVRHVKISAKELLARTKNERQFAETLRMKRKLEGNGIAVIAEKIETERELKELLDFDIGYGQGYLFGKPDAQEAYQQKTAQSKNPARKLR